MRRGARARARANIALAKYWGKRDDALNLPAVPSISITLDPLVTETTVMFDESLDQDRFELDGAPGQPDEAGRVSRLLDEVRARTDVDQRAYVASVNHFPTAAGLASSASGFAALAGAASAAAGLDASMPDLSAMARRASASAARSIFGGFVELPVGDDDSLAALPLAGPEHWDLRVVVAVTASGRKAIGSRPAMSLSRRTSIYWDAWVSAAGPITTGIRDALLRRDLPRLIPLVEQSFLAMHAVTMTATPPILYWEPASVAALSAIRRLRERGVEVCATMDAGPHVKAVCHADDAGTVETALAGTDNVLHTFVARPGPGIEVETLQT